MAKSWGGREIFVLRVWDLVIHRSVQVQVRWRKLEVEVGEFHFTIW